MFYYIHRINMVYINILSFLLIACIVNAQELNSITKILSISEQKCNDYGSTVNNCDFQQDYIPGLVNANPKEFPHVALIGFGESDSISWKCNGFLISERYVMTAGFCVSGLRGQPKWIRLGDLNTELTNEDAQPQDFTVEDITIHPDYTNNSFYNDIALIRLNKDVTITSYIRPACLQTLKDFSSQNVINSGWGTIEITSPIVKDMKKATLQKYSNEECNAVFNNGNNRRLANGIIDDIQICAGSPNPNNDLCIGSSGSPLQIYHPKIHCMYNIVGISSFGKTCGEPNVPAVYTRIANYVPWIETVVWPTSTSNSDMEEISSISEQSITEERIGEQSISEQKCNEYESMVNGCDFQQQYVPGLVKAKPKEFPHVAILGFGEQDSVPWNCNGMLISERCVLIAAHCVTGRLGKPKMVRLGDLNLKLTTDDAQTQEFNVERIIVHPDYKVTQKYHDLAIVRLDKDVTFTPYVRPACLQTLEDFPSENLINSGWGKIDWNNPPRFDMMKATIQKYSYEECNRKLMNEIDDGTQICAGSPNPKKGLCEGSGGSSLQIYHPKFRCMYNIVGIGSFGETCGVPNIPSVFTRISNYVYWIEKVVWSNMSYIETTTIENNNQNSDAAPSTNSNNINKYLNNCGRPLNHIPLVVGGTEPARDQYLWLTSLFRSRDGVLNFTCGGSLITDRHVMTAAHCIQNRYGDRVPSNYLVVMVGKFNIDDWDQTGVFTSGVHHYYIHERFNKGGTLNDDISVLVLTKTVDFVQFSNIRTVCLWSMDSTISTIVGLEGVVVGWGRDENGRQQTSTPRELNVPIVSQEECLYSEVKHFVNNKTLCAGSKDGKGPCTGDSGGGLFMWVGDRYYIRGIVSLSLVDQDTRSCDLREYSLYTDVAKYLSWIENKVDII